MTQSPNLYLFADVDREDTRRKIVVIVLVILWMVVLEGAVRKWFAPGLSKPLLFIKDPLVLVVYYLALQNGLIPRDSGFLKVGLVLSVLFVLLGAMHCVGIPLPAAVAIYGWRLYFFLIPLAFVIGECFTGKDLKTMLKHSMIMVVINGLLCVVQSRLPPSHWINTTVADTAIFVYGEGEGIARASGTFSFTYGHEIFAASTVPMILALWLTPASQRGMSFKLLAFYSLCGLANVLLDGNRGVFLFIAINLLACLPGYWYLRDPRLRKRALMLPFIACGIGALMYLSVFASSMQAMTHRIVTTEEGESSVERIFMQFGQAGTIMRKGDILGAGLGLGSGGGQSLVGIACPYEYEIPRLMWESGVLGLAYLLYRCALTAHIGVDSLQASVRASNLLPLLLFSFVVQMLPVGQMTSNATCVYYGWLFAGFCLAANRLGLAR